MPCGSNRKDWSCRSAFGCAGTNSPSTLVCVEFEQFVVVVFFQLADLLCQLFVLFDDAWLIGISIAHQWIETTTWDAQVQESEPFSSALRPIRLDLAGLAGKLRGEALASTSWGLRDAIWPCHLGFLGPDGLFPALSATVRRARRPWLGDGL